MNPEDRIAQGLETGEDQGFSAPEQARLDELRAVLGSEVVWEEPPANLGDRIEQEIGGEQTAAPLRWIWAAAAAVVLVIGTVAITNLFDGVPPPVAVVSVTGTEWAPGATATADLISFPNGWAIRFDARGLPPAEPGTFYQGWVNNGQTSVPIGTFQMRGEPAPIPLWSGVDLHEYRTINITLQQEGAGPESSGVLVMTGTAESFDDE